MSDRDYGDNWIASNGLSLLERAPKGSPWLLYVNFAGPHPPMDITTSMERRYRGPDRVIDGFPQPHDYRGTIVPEHHLRIRQNYAAMIENIDRWVGVYLDTLERRGELDNTIIVYSSDHGEMLGDHGRWGKSVPFHPSANVPLYVAGPGVRAGHRSDALVSLMDLAATFLDYGGVEVPEDMDSRSIRPVLEGKTEKHRDYVLSGLRDWRLAWDGRYKYITGFEQGRGPGVRSGRGSARGSKSRRRGAAQGGATDARRPAGTGAGAERLRSGGAAAAPYAAAVDSAGAGPTQNGLDQACAPSSCVTRT